MANNILKHVDILDLVVINIFKGKPTLHDPNPYVVAIDPIDATKRVVFDTDALKVLNAKLTEKIRGTDSTQPNTIQFIKEFAGKMLSGLYRNGLVAIEDLPPAKEDHYAEARKQFLHRK